MAARASVNLKRLRCVALREAGLTAGQIAERLGISRNAVIGHWWRHDNGNGKTLAENERGPRLIRLRLAPAASPETPAPRDSRPPRSGRA